MHKRRQAKGAKTGKPRTLPYKSALEERRDAAAAEQNRELGIREEKRESASKGKLALAARGFDDVESVSLDHARMRRRGRHDGDPAAELVIAARLSRRLGVSTVTLWRWRHDERLGFPKGRRINDRVYFPWHEVTAWVERQQQTA
jgi:predicted DNA-binding transcriptional regulator AlpA